MRIKSIVQGPLVCTGLLVACGEPDAPSGKVSTVVEEAVLTCTSDVAIWERPTSVASCPPAPGWSRAPLFPGTAAPGLARFCEYRWTGAGAPNYAQLNQALGPGQIADPDCYVVSPLGLGDSPLVWEPLRATFHRQADRVPTMPAGSAPVQVAVLDTARLPPVGVMLDRSTHARAVDRIIQDLACPSGGTCSVSVRNHLAMPMEYEWHRPSDAYGGHFGSRSQLAKAIVTAVDTWVSEYIASPSTAAQRLILNMSLGWVPEWGGTDPSTLPASSRTVLAALQHSACYGALNIVAAGNSSGSGKGAMLPAAWESVPAPTFCGAPYSSFPNPWPRTPSPSGYAPLVHAIGGVDSRDFPLATTRVDGLPRLVAYANSVVTTDALPGQPTAALSGTSAAAAIATSAAAASWIHRPAWTADRVMRNVYDNAVELDPEEMAGRSTELGLTGFSSNPVKRVSVCSAARSACNTGCSPLAVCPTVEAHEGTDPALPTDLAGLFGLPLGSSAACTPGVGPGTCGTEGETRLVWPWTSPQPTHPCTRCDLYAFQNLALQLDPGTGVVINAITLVAFDRLGLRIQSLSIRPPDGMAIYPNSFGVTVSLPNTTASVKLDFAMTDPRGPLLEQAPVVLY